MIALRLPDVDGVGFDLDGTLFDHPSAAAAGIRAVYADHGIDASGANVEAWFAAEARHFPRWASGELSFVEQRRERVRDLFTFLGRAQPDDEAADALFVDFLAAYRRHWRAYPDAIETLERLRASGVRIGVLTNGPIDQQRDKLDTVGLTAYVDVVCAADEMGVAKPDARAFAVLAERLGVARDRLVHIGDDADADLAGAQRAGVRTALVRSRGRAVAELPSALRRAAASRIAATDEAGDAIVR